MTKYSINPDLAVPEKQEPKKTVLKRRVFSDSVEEAFIPPGGFKNVQLLWRDNRYGDVFAAWDNDPNNRSLYFGEAGDEFGQLPPKP